MPLTADSCISSMERNSQSCFGRELAAPESVRTLMALVEAVEQRDGHVAGHCERLAGLSVLVGMAMGLEQPDLWHLYHAGYLHDIGKIGVPDSILLKPGKLTAQEWEVMRDHPARGEEICRYLTALEPVLPAIRFHHERWDGTGYPDGLRGEQIPLLARVLQVTDIYDALVNPRPYKPAFTGHRALEILQEETARGWRDPDIVRGFAQFHRRGLFRDMDAALGPFAGSLSNLQRFLANCAAGSLNGRTSFRPLPLVPADGSPEEEEGMWHTE